MGKNDRSFLGRDAPATQASMCAGKDALTHSQASTIARRMNKAGKPTQAYKCIVCGEWHVGHKPPNWSRRRNPKTGGFM